MMWQNLSNIFKQRNILEYLLLVSVSDAGLGKNNSCFLD